MGICGGNSGSMIPLPVKGEAGELSPARPSERVTLAPTAGSCRARTPRDAACGRRNGAGQVSE